MGQRRNCGIRSFEEADRITCFKPCHKFSCSQSIHTTCFRPCSCNKRNSNIKEKCPCSTENIASSFNNKHHHNKKNCSLFKLNCGCHRRKNHCTCRDNF